MAIETGLEGKPWYVSGAVGLGLGVVIVVAAYYVMFTDMQQQIVRKEGSLEELDRQINEGRAAQRSLPQFREEVRGLELELEKLLRILPTRRNTEDLLRRVRTLAEQADFSLLRFTPRSPTPQDFYSEWPILISLEGSYHNLALFFDRIRRFSRIINIEDLRINVLKQRGGENGHHTIGAQFTIKTFLYNDPEDEEEDG